MSQRASRKATPDNDFNWSYMPDFGDFVLWLMIVVRVIYVPFTKVEESFNLQATHDILFHGFDIDKYDHLEFPGVVPRTFLGPLSLAVISSPIVYPLLALGVQKIVAQYIVRIVLGTLFAYAYGLLRRSITPHFGELAATAFNVVSFTQFHVIFYATRTLPNTFAFILVLIGYALWLSGNYKQTLVAFVFSAAVFRSETVMLYIPIGLYSLLRRETVWSMITVGVAASVCAAGLSVAVDSYFWRRWLWPEFEVLWFNTALNKSSEWGTSPWHWYITSALPRALLPAAVVFAIYGVYRDAGRLRVVLLPAVVHVALYSFLPHKELRFVMYVVPLINIAAAVGLAHVVRELWSTSEGKTEGKSHNTSLLRKAFHLGMLSLLFVSAVLGMALTVVAHHNYPGGVALTTLHATYNPSTNIYFHSGADQQQQHRTQYYVHIDVAAAETGVSRFLEWGPPWRYSKAENLTIPEHFAAFTHLITEKPHVPGFEMVDEILGFERVDIRPMPRIVTAPKLYIHTRKSTP